MNSSCFLLHKSLNCILCFCIVLLILLLPAHQLWSSQRRPVVRYLIIQGHVLPA